MQSRALILTASFLIAGAGHSVLAQPGETPPTPAPAPAPPPGGGGMPTVPTVQQPAPPETKPEDMPTAVRMRRLEQKTQALKERAWQLKARVAMLKEQMIGGGVGAQAIITHTSDMGSSFRILRLSYSLDGTEIFVRSDEEGETLYKTTSFDVFTGPISPGSHSLVATAVYRGHGFGVFNYLSQFTFTVKAPQTFIVGEGKVTKVACKGYEKGNATVAIEKRAAIECKVSEAAPEKTDKPVQTTPGTTPIPETGK